MRAAQAQGLAVYLPAREPSLATQVTPRARPCVPQKLPAAGRGTPRGAQETLQKALLAPRVARRTQPGPLAMPRAPATSRPPPGGAAAAAPWRISAGPAQPAASASTPRRPSGAAAAPPAAAAHGPGAALGALAAAVARQPVSGASGQGSGALAQRGAAGQEGAPSQARGDPARRHSAARRQAPDQAPVPPRTPRAAALQQARHPLAPEQAREGARAPLAPQRQPGQTAARPPRALVGVPGTPRRLQGTAHVSAAPTAQRPPLPPLLTPRPVRRSLAGDSGSAEAAPPLPTPRSSRPTAHAPALALATPRGSAAPKLARRPLAKQGPLALASPRGPARAAPGVGLAPEPSRAPALSLEGSLTACTAFVGPLVQTPRVWEPAGGASAPDGGGDAQALGGAARAGGADVAAPAGAAGQATGLSYAQVRPHSILNAMWRL